MRRAPLVPIALLFFVSGATALSAEVALSKLLTYVFGSSHLATSTVLAAYMAGLSAGAWLFGRAAPRLGRPIAVYAALELLVGAFYALLPVAFGPFQRLAIGAASPLAGSPALLTAIRFALAFALVFAPTLMMGGTLPTLVSAFPGASLRRSLPLLYAANTLGAAAGTLVASYAAIPALGLDGTLYACAALNTCVGAAALALGRRAAAPEMPEAQVAGDATPAYHLPPRAVVALAFAEGAIAFALEVVWAHLIGTVIGATAYAFALMLFAILLGIGAGSLALPRITRRRPPAAVFVWAMLVLALSIAASLRGWDRFGTVVRWTHGLAVPGRFWGRELVRLGFCLVLLLPASLALGVALPSLAASARREGHDHARWVGRVFAANTLGTIAGSLFTGFVLLGRVRSDRILEIAAASALALGAAAFALARPAAERPPRRERTALLAGALAVVALALAFPGFDPQRLTLGMHYYWYLPELAVGDRVETIAEDAQSGFITVSRARDGTRVLKTNGKYEGSDAPVEFQDLFALIGGLYVQRFDRAAVVGIGPARTLRALHEMPFRHVEAVEYSPAMIEAASRDFGGFARAPFDDAARVTVSCDDGRNHLQLSRERYDYVAIAISGAAFSGSGNIYSRDFFEAVRGRLAPGGVFMLWVQIHHVLPADVRSVVFTLRQVFPHVHVYTDAGHAQGYLLASESELVIDPRRVEDKLGAPWIRDALDRQGMASALDLVERSVFTTDAELERYFASAAVGAAPVLLTDLRPAFEYAAPFGLATDLHRYDFEPLSDKILPRFSPALPESERAALERRRRRAAGDVR